MPVIKLRYDRIKRFVDDDPETIVEWIPWIGVDIEEVTDEYVKIEYNPNRPDFGSLPGIMRAYMGIRRYEIGLIEYKTMENSDEFEIIVDNNIKKIRPYIAALVAKDIFIDDDLLTELIEFQEDLHSGIGRKRRKISIGIHNLDVIKFPVKYKAMSKEFKFIPLEMDREMSIEEILKEHPKGLEYGYILSSYNKYPILIDREDTVLSFPPIINGIYTQVDIGTRNLFIDITGIDYELVNKALDILGTALHDYGAKIYKVNILDPDIGEYYTPLFKYEEISLNKKIANKMLGLELNEQELEEAILSARLGIEKKEEEEWTIRIPPYRIDILHPVDIIEDIAIGYGYWRIEPDLSLFFTAGQLDENTKTIDKIVDILVGLGFLETIHSHLTNPELIYDKMNSLPDSYIEVEHPKTSTYRILRTWIIPQLLDTYSISKRDEYPQKIFEVGKVFTREDLEGKVHLATAVAHSSANYSEIKSVLDTLLESLVEKYEIRYCKHPSFIEGRSGKIYYRDLEIGIIGEIHPAVLSNFKVEVPVAAFEIDLTSLMGIKNL